MTLQDPQSPHHRRSDSHTPGDSDSVGRLKQIMRQESPGVFY